MDEGGVVKKGAMESEEGDGAGDGAGVGPHFSSLVSFKIHFETLIGVSESYMYVYVRERAEGKIFKPLQYIYLSNYVTIYLSIYIYLSLSLLLSLY